MSCKPELWLPFVKKGEQVCVDIVPESPSQEAQLMESIVCQDNMLKAYRHVKRNGGSPGIDGMTVKELEPYLVPERKVMKTRSISYNLTCK